VWKSEAWANSTIQHVRPFDGDNHPLGEYDVNAMRVFMQFILILSLFLQPLLGLPDARCAFGMGVEAGSAGVQSDAPKACCCCDGVTDLTQCPMSPEQMASCAGIDRETNSSTTVVDQSGVTFAKLLTAHLAPFVISEAQERSAFSFRPDPERVAVALPFSRPSLCVWLT
jgi:hypothetical protein